MSRSAAVTTSEHTLYATLELSKNSWLLAIQFPDRDNPSLHPIKGGGHSRSIKRHRNLAHRDAGGGSRPPHQNPKCRYKTGTEVSAEPAVKSAT